MVGHLMFALMFGVIAGLGWFALHYLVLLFVRVVGVLLVFAVERAQALVHHWPGVS